MDSKDWIAIGIAAITLLNGWCQFWVKERLFADKSVTGDPVLQFFKGKGGVTIIAFTGIISILTVVAILNLVLVQAIFTIRRLAEMKQGIEEAKRDALAYSVIFGG